MTYTFTWHQDITHMKDHDNLRSWEHSWLRLFDQQSGKAAELFYLLKAWGRVGQNEQTSDPTQKNSDLPPPPNLKRPPDLPPRPTCRTPQARQSRQGIKQRDTGVTASRSRKRGEQEGRGKWQAVRAKTPRINSGWVGCGKKNWRSPWTCSQNGVRIKTRWSNTHLNKLHPSSKPTLPTDGYNLRSWEHSWLRLFDQQSGKAAELFYLLKAWGRVGQNEQTSDPTQKNSDLPPPPNLKRPPDLPPRPTCRTPQARQSRQGIKQRDTGVTASRSRKRGEQEGRGKWQAVRAKHPRPKFFRAKVMSIKIIRADRQAKQLQLWPTQLFRPWPDHFLTANLLGWNRLKHDRWKHELSGQKLHPRNLEMSRHKSSLLE